MSSTAYDVDPIQVLADGTIKQRHPLSGTEVWTVPGRGNRPLVAAGSERAHDGPTARGVPCAFCPERMAEVPPEKARVVRGPGGFETMSDVPPEDLDSTPPDFRRIPNLFEIVSAAYWRDNHAHVPSQRSRARQERWLSSAVGRERVERVLRARFLASGRTEDEWESTVESDRLEGAFAFFDGGHDLIVPRRHLTDDGASLASSGTLTATEHAAYTAFTVATMGDLYDEFGEARYVAAFQNWLAPAGASFDHLHKQLVTIDEIGEQARRELARVEADPDAYDRHLTYVREQGLVIAENEHAVAFAGFGHRYPTLEVRAKVATLRPFEMSSAQVEGFSDLLHAVHVATGPEIPCNEEWLHRPRGVDVPMPWRVHLKWRVSTLAGFEGGTRIFVTTISPWRLRDRVRAALVAASRESHLAPSVGAIQ